MSVSIRKLTVVLLLSVSLTACGFHPRHSMPLPPDFKAVAVTSGNPYGALTQQVSQILTSMQVDVLPEPKDAPFTLSLFGESIYNHMFSQSASSLTKQYTLTYSISYQLQASDGTIIYGPKYITAFRNYMVNERQILSTTTEQQILSTDLQHDLVYQLMTQLGSHDVADAICHYTAKQTEHHLEPTDIHDEVTSKQTNNTASSNA